MSKDKCCRSPLANGIGFITSAVAGVIGGWIAYSATAIDHDLPLVPAIDASREEYISRLAGYLSYYADTSGSGRPLVLLHSINAAASAYEVKPLFEHYRGSCPVYALDLPGFGFSDRSDRAYSPRLYEDAIISFLDERVGQPADVVALSLTSEFAAWAALHRPDLFHSLAMISPSGFTVGDMRSSQQASASGASDKAYKLLAFPLWSQALYDFLATESVIHFFLKQSFEGPVHPGLEEYCYATSHQPGARYAPLYFVSGKLFTPNVRERVYARLSVPVLVLYDRDAYVRFDALPDFASQRENWHTSRIVPSKGLPHFERPDETVHALDNFWQRLG